MLVQVQISQQTFINLIILGKYRFPPKKFYNINYSSKVNLPGAEIVSLTYLVWHVNVKLNQFANYKGCNSDPIWVLIKGKKVYKSGRFGWGREHSITL